MTITYLGIQGGVPALFLDEKPTAPIIAYAGPRYLRTFLQAGIRLFTFYVPGSWWIGANQYDFSGIDAFLADYTSHLGDAFFMPRIDLSSQGSPWWGKQHPDEMNILRSIETGEILDQTAPNPRALPYLGHEVDLSAYNLHSFHSQVWRDDAARAVASLVAHCESQPYAGRIWGWHLCDGLFCEWFHWNEYSFDGMADYSPAALADFRRWLRIAYHDDPCELSRAWGEEMDFDNAQIPTPRRRITPSHGEFYHPIADRPVIDYTRCFNEATADSIIAVCRAAKRALPQPKVTCVFYGYQFSNMPRPQLNAHYAVQKLLDSDAVDMFASPHAYSNRGEGGYHSPQAIADSIRRAGKLHIDEIDCKTVWTPPTVTWKRHISQPTTVEGTIEMMKKDAAYQLASGTAQWWMDLTDEGWFDAPEAVEPIRRLRLIEERLMRRCRKNFGEVALVLSQRSMMFQSPREGLHNVTLKIFRNWHLSRMGAPFEQILLDDLAKPDTPSYKLYIMANLFYLSSAERSLLSDTLKRNQATALWIYAPGFLDDTSASLEKMQEITGFRFGMEDIFDELDVVINNYAHPITASLPPEYAYGSGIRREQYLRPPKIQYLPETRIRPAFYIDDPQAQVLGTAIHVGKPGLAVKLMDGWQSIYSSAPLLPWELMRNICRYAGVHLYDESGDMIWANNAFLAVYSQADGIRHLRFPHRVNLRDAYEDRPLAAGVQEVEMNMHKWETKLFELEEI